MNTTSIDPTTVERTPTHSSPKVLWAAIGTLAVAVAALGGVLLHQQGRNGAPDAATIAAAPATRAPAPDDFKPDEPQPAAPVPPAVNSAAFPRATTLPPPVRAPEVQPPKVAQASPAPGPAPAPARAPVCSVCGHVESVRTVEHPAPATGVGAVGGGVVGGLIGNQIGHGNGRTAATVLGAVGGGFAGNEIEKRTRTVTSYQVSVRMEDGSLRTVETSTAPPIGKAVTLQGKVLRPADGRK
ncbi:glycine zipper 2TM domain-containing protein [Variovorax sp. J22P240]|uniref:glycine zipper 2TM domain-containing protein n=1 Tax=unclassified Variovorax TaxID=663243 RepID=UPI002577774C|nr:MULTISPECIES: glycine zipper 2TM domain-containing protein [unclassified Variovorax]MDM0001412.1 glycine zipper 2TM domain-containing protein [Variovorax sp. J22P240]MDM0050963.1 glycine zipper 2TM domain-containing protein [Variovorax sp. J22R115]